MHEDASRPIRAMRFLAALAGPAAAAAHELDLLALGPAATLWPVFGVVLAAGIGIIASIAFTRGSSLRRWISLIPNGAVLLFYGFLLLFFGFGASR